MLYPRLTPLDEDEVGICLLIVSDMDVLTQMLMSALVRAASETSSAAMPVASRQGSGFCLDQTCSRG